MTEETVADETESDEQAEGDSERTAAVPKSTADSKKPESEDPGSPADTGTEREAPDSPAATDTTEDDEEAPVPDETEAARTQSTSEAASDDEQPDRTERELVQYIKRLRSNVTSLEQSVEQSQRRIEELESELADYERRNEREHEDIRKYAIADFAQEMLKVNDMLGDAIDIEEFEEGTERRLRMVQKRFEKVLTSGEIRRIEPEVQAAYDDRLHRMERKVSKEGFEREEIVRVLEVGYETHGRVLRPARVEVATGQDA